MLQLRLKSELLFDGIADRTVHVSYREYYRSSDGSYVARAPFFRQLTYDLSNSKTIVFKEVKIEVDSVNNERIYYSVVSEPDFKVKDGQPVKIGE